MFLNKNRTMYNVQKHNICVLLPVHAGFLLGLLFHHEDAGDMFLRNMGLFLQTTEHCAHHTHGRDNFKSNMLQGRLSVRQDVPARGPLDGCSIHYMLVTLWGNSRGRGS
jgi:hypothetical protein